MEKAFRPVLPLKVQFGPAVIVYLPEESTLIPIPVEGSQTAAALARTASASADRTRTNFIPIVTPEPLTPIKSQSENHLVCGILRRVVNTTLALGSAEQPGFSMSPRRM